MGEESDDVQFQKVMDSIKNERRYEFVKSLCSKNPKLAKMTKKDVYNGNTVLLQAVEFNDLEMVKLLHKNGADLYETDEDGNTGFLRAAQRGKNQGFKLTIAENLEQ